MNLRDAVLLVPLVLAGCTTHRVDLDPKFRPLTSVQEVSNGTPALGEGMVATIYSTSYTKDVQALVDAYSVGSVEWDALFFHERMHAVREFDDPLFLVRYALEKEFRWGEEMLGYREEIRYLREHSRRVDVEWYVAVLSGSAYGNMVGPEDARAWVLKVLGEP